MPKQCLVEVFIKDASGNVVDIQSAQGTAEDASEGLPEGSRVTVPIGYLPGLPIATPENIKVTVYHPATEITPVGLVARSEDYQSGVQAIEFNLSP